MFHSANELIAIMDYDVNLLTQYALFVFSAIKHNNAYIYFESLNIYSAALLLSRWLVAVSCFFLFFSFALDCVDFHDLNTSDDQRGVENRRILLYKMSLLKLKI